MASLVDSGQLIRCCLTKAQFGSHSEFLLNLKKKKKKLFFVVVFESSALDKIYPSSVVKRMLEKLILFSGPLHFSLESLDEPLL